MYVIKFKHSLCICLKGPKKIADTQTEDIGPPGRESNPGSV
jgi:hypothetical protein